MENWQSRGRALVRGSLTPASDHARPRAGRERGALITECVFALGLFTLAVFPLTYGFLLEAKYSRTCYHKAATMEIVDGEAEILAAGEWRAYGPGTHAYKVTASAATNLPPGGFTLVVDPSRLRLEWRPADGRTNGIVARERTLP